MLATVCAACNEPTLIQVRTRVGEGDIEVDISQICLKEEVGGSLASGMKVLDM